MTQKSSKEHTCKNHPERGATKRCQTCLQYICKDCQLIFLNKTFCSLTCLVKALARSIMALLNIKPRTPAQKQASLISKIHIKPAQLFLNLLYITLILAIFLSLQNLAKEIRLLRFSQQAKIAEPAEKISIQEKFAVTEAPGAMVRSNKIDISGEADKDLILSLIINGELKAVTIPEKGTFHFENVLINYGNNEIIVRGTDTAGNSIVLESIKTVFGSPRLDYLARDVTRGNKKVAKIALTFDGGAGNGATGHILDYLSQKNIRCTMFLTGNFIKRYPDMVKRMVEDGHEIGNHTWSHPHLTTFEINNRHNTLPKITRDSLQDELKKTNERFKKITGQNMVPLWRAPFGEHNLQIRRWASELGYTQIGWTIGNGETMDTLDWVADTTSVSYKKPEAILEKILNFGQDTENKTNGGIILMHLDTQRTKDQPYEIIPSLIDSLQQRGYELVTVSELLNS